MPKDPLLKAGIVLGCLAGVAAGVGLFTFVYARGASYMTNDPAACANCHIMRNHFDAWAKSSHHQVAVCNDCHTPETFIGKYYTKGLNGYHHSVAFTTGIFHEPIQITERNLSIAEANCRRCHQDVVDQIEGMHGGDDSLSCIRCHDSVGHLE